MTDPPPPHPYPSVYSAPTQHHPNPAPRHPEYDIDTEIPLPGTGRAEPRTTACLCGIAIREPWIKAFDRVPRRGGHDAWKGCFRVRAARCFVRHVSSFNGVSCLWLYSDVCASGGLRDSRTHREVYITTTQPNSQHAVHITNAHKSHVHNGASQTSSEAISKPLSLFFSFNHTFPLREPQTIH